MFRVRGISYASNSVRSIDTGVANCSFSQATFAIIVAMLVAIGIFRAGGAMEWLIAALTPLTNVIGMPAEALPMALMRPLSGSGSLGIMAEIMAVYGPDSFIGILTSTFFGSTETTFYVLAVYFGSVNIRNTRHALAAGLLADISGILGAVFIVRLLFG